MGKPDRMTIRALSRLDVVFSQQCGANSLLRALCPLFFVQPGQNALLNPATLVLFFGSFDKKCMQKTLRS